jgi:4-azaleucine resistance transporter AzlC
VNGLGEDRAVLSTPAADSISSATRAAEFWAGVRATIPLVIGAIPFALIFGASAVTGGLSAAGAAAMSALVFAGSAQFIAVGLVAAGAGVAVIVFTTWIVNLRHALYAISLAPHMKHLSQRWLAPLSFWLTDETFVVVIQRYGRNDASPFKHWYYLGSALFMYVNWQICTWIGIWVGRSVADPLAWGLDFALVVTFIGMLVPMLRERPALLAAAAAGGCSVLFYALPHQLGLVLATVVGVGVGVVATQRRTAGTVSESQDA